MAITWSNTVPNAGPNAAAGLPLAVFLLGSSRSCSSTVWPAGTVTLYQKAHLVPLRSGLTVAAPWITWSLMPSLGYGVIGSAPYRRFRLVSFSQNNAAGAAPSGPESAISSSEPSHGCSIPTAPSPVADRVGLGSSSSQDQVLRNQAVGSTCRVSASGPLLVTEIFISRSSGSALA